MTRVRPLALAGVACSAIVLAACGSSSSNATSTTSPPATTKPVISKPATAKAAPPGLAALKSIGAAKASSDTVSLAKAAPGIFLIGPNGHSLYIYAKDKGTTSACTGACAKAWPALTTTGAITAGPAIAKAQVGTANGQVAHQVTYYGHLLYYFSGDKAPGQTMGASISGWHLLGPFGNVMLPGQKPKIPGS